MAASRPPNNVSLRFIDFPSDHRPDDLISETAKSDTTFISVGLFIPRELPPLEAVHSLQLGLGDLCSHVSPVELHDVSASADRVVRHQSKILAFCRLLGKLFIDADNNR